MMLMAQRCRSSWPETTWEGSKRSAGSCVTLMWLLQVYKLYLYNNKLYMQRSNDSSRSSHLFPLPAKYLPHVKNVSCRSFHPATLFSDRERNGSKQNKKIRFCSPMALWWKWWSRLSSPTYCFYQIETAGLVKTGRGKKSKMTCNVCVYVYIIMYIGVSSIWNFSIYNILF